MNEKVKAFLDAKKDAERQKYEKDKRQTLLNLGLWEKVYSDKYGGEFVYSEWDSENGKSRYYKIEEIDISDEEYEEVKRYSGIRGVLGDNPIATALTVIAWIVFIGGFIAGIAFGKVEVVKGSYYTYTDTEFSFAIAFTYWCVALISGTMFLGFAEVIKLLEEIKSK